MSGELVPQPGDDRAALLAAIDRGEIATTLSAAQIKTLHAMLDEQVVAGEAFRARLREFCGPELTSLPAHLAVMHGQGIGYVRHCRDVIEMLCRALYKARARQRAESQKGKQDSLDFQDSHPPAAPPRKSQKRSCRK